jgi:hypothetical protein
MKYTQILILTIVLFAAFSTILCLERHHKKHKLRKAHHKKTKKTPHSDADKDKYFFANKKNGGKDDIPQCPPLGSLEVSLDIAKSRAVCDIANNLDASEEIKEVNR